MAQATYPGTYTGRINVPLFGLAPSGVYPATVVTNSAVRSYRTISTLPVPRNLGGIFSAALSSVGSRPPGITWHSALWSPDFPPYHPEGRYRDCLADFRPLPYSSLERLASLNNESNYGEKLWGVVAPAVTLTAAVPTKVTTELPVPGELSASGSSRSALQVSAMV